MPVTDQMHRSVNIPDHPQRIISLVPSQTELLHQLGLGERVVGITKFCIHPDEWFRSKTRVGGTKKVDPERVRQLKPDLIIGNKEENSRKDIEVLEKEFPVWMSDVRDLPQALEMIAMVGHITNTSPTAQAVITRIQQGFAHLRPLEEPIPAAYLIWRRPYMAVGPDTFIHDMMARCGLRNVFAEGADRYLEVDAALLCKAAPRVILLSSEPFPFKAKHRPEILSILPESRVLLVNGEPFSWYGSRLFHAPAYFARVVKEATA